MPTEELDKSRSLAGKLEPLAASVSGSIGRMGFTKGVKDEAFQRAGGRCECTHAGHGHFGRCEATVTRHSAQFASRQVKAEEPKYTATFCEVLCVFCARQLASNSRG
jgi:hypothetical protein